MIGHVLSETKFIFCFCVLFSKFYPNLNLLPNIGVLCNFYSKVIFVLEKYTFGFHFYQLNLNNWTCWESASKVPTLQISA